MGRTRTFDDIDHDINPEESLPARKRPRKRPPEPGQLPKYTPMRIQPQSTWHTVSNLPQHVNPARAWQIFNLFLTNELLETLARHTNEYAALHRQQPLPQFARPWVDTTPKELLAYIATYIYMGLHLEADIAEYWNTNGSKGPLHPQVRRNIGLKRWQQLDRFFHISAPKELQDQQEQGQQPQDNKLAAIPAIFQKLEPLNEHIRSAAKKYWNPTTHLSIDECIQRFQGRAKEKVKIPSKPAPEGFKIWALANNGYILDWLYHARGIGPVDLDDYWTEDRGLPATQAVVLDLLLQAGIHNDARHVVWLDNLFTSARLLSTLREEGFGAAGTVRTTKTKAEWMTEDTQQSQQSQRERNRGLHPSLAELKPDFSGQIPWGKLYGCLSEDGKVLQFVWKDQNVVLFMSTVSEGPPNFVKKIRKRPPLTATNARTTRAVFGDQVMKELEISEFIHLYNQFMGGVDQADQLRVYHNTQRVHLKSWKPLWHWLLDVAIVNSYKLSYHAQHYDDPDLPCERYTRQRFFRRDLANELLDRSERLTTGSYDRSVSLTDIVYPAEDDEEHTPYERGRNGHCKACEAAGRKATPSSASRKPLKELSSNSLWKRQRRSSTRPPKSRSGCTLCCVSLCRTSTCWNEHLQLAREAATI